MTTENILIILIPAILAVVLNKFLIPRILLVAYRKRLFDPVTARKLHSRIIPRLGGISFVPIQFLLFSVTVVLVFKFGVGSWDVQSWALIPHFVMLFCGLIMLFIMGIGDDLIGVGYKWKFCIHLLVASFFPLSGLWINNLYGLGFLVELSPYVGMPLTVFLVVLIINAVNLMDGLDGLCSGLVGIGCLMLGILFLYYGALIHALFAFITTGLLVPFFYYNVFGMRRRGRQIFMGDTGSTTLGYSIAFLAVSFSMHNEYIKPFSEGAIVVAYSVLMIPVLDVARVMYVRWRQNTPVFQADRNHLHHLLLRLGLSHRNTMIIIIFSSLFFIVFNVIAVEIMSNNFVLVIDLVLWLLMHIAVGKLERQRSANIKTEKGSLMVEQKI